MLSDKLRSEYYYGYMDSTFTVNNAYCIVYGMPCHFTPTDMPTIA